MGRPRTRCRAACSCRRERRRPECCCRTDHHLFRQLEVEHFGEEAAVLDDLVHAFGRLDLGDQKAVIQMHRAHALDVIRPRVRIKCAYAPAHCILFGEQHHPMAARQREADCAAHERNRAGPELFDRDTPFRYRVAQSVEFGVALHLVGDVIGAGMVRRSEDHAIAIPFVPGLVIGGSTALAMGFDEPDNVGVMVAGLFDVSYSNRNVSDAHYRHDSALHGVRMARC